jgi:hypothetical protein
VHLDYPSQSRRRHSPRGRAWANQKQNICQQKILHLDPTRILAAIEAYVTRSDGIDFKSKRVLLFVARKGLDTSGNFSPGG